LFLTREEERMLDGEYGEATRIAMRLIVRVGEALGAERLVKVEHAHASGISYFNIGDAGLEFLERLARDGRVRVFSTFNPTGVPLEVNTDVLPVDSLSREKQLRILQALLRMGFKLTATCIPYMVRRPRIGEHLAWGESSAVAAANTLYGARTNREGGPIAVAAALTGRTYYWGLHLDEARRPNILVSLEGEKPLDIISAGLLGYYLGEQLRGSDIPYIDAKVSSKRGVIAMCAAGAASGSISMCVVRRYSPEDRGPPSEAEDKIKLSIRDLREVRERVETASLDEAEAFFTGCPHHWLDVLNHLAHMVALKGISRLRKPVYVATPAVVPAWARRLALELRRKNIYIIPGTCLVVARISKAYNVIATDSLKSAFYLPKRQGVRVALSTLEEFIEKYGG
jgi:predicted aconitase